MVNKEQILNHLVKEYCQGKTKSAIKGFLKLIKKYPDFYFAYYNLAVIYKKKGLLKKAIFYLKKVIEKNPQFALAINELALCYKQLGDYQKTISLLKQAEKIEPKNWEIKYNLAIIYQILQVFDEAEKYYSLAFSLNKNADFILINLAQIIFLKKDYQKVKEISQLLLKNCPNKPEIYQLLGHIAYKEENYQKAIDYYQKVVSLNPDYDLGYSCLFMAKRRICNWENLKEIDLYLNKTFNQDPWGCLLRTDDLKINFQTAKKWSQRIYQTLPKIRFQFNLKDYQNKKLKIGYLASNTDEHPVGYMLKDLLKNHNRNLFQIYLYSYNSNKNSPTYKALKKLADFFYDIDSFSNINIAEKIFEDKICFLIDLTGFTEGNRSDILFYKPAPVQINWSEYLGSMGNSFYDYIIADEVLIKKEEEKYFSEKIIYLSSCSYLRQMHLTAFKSYQKKDFNLPEDKFIFGCFHQFIKIEPMIWSLWMEILKKTENSILWLWSQNKEGEENLKKYAIEENINPQRLIFTPTLPVNEFYSRIGLADLALDTFVYGGGITNFQCLARGVPFLTYYGKHIPSRVGTDLLKKIELEDLVAYSTEEYIKKAIDFYNSQKKLDRIKKYLSSKKVIRFLFNNKKTIQELENQLLDIWRKKSSHSLALFDQT